MHFKHIGNPFVLIPLGCCPGSAVYCSAVQPLINGRKVVVVRLRAPDAAGPPISPRSSCLCRRSPEPFMRWVSTSSSSPPLTRVASSATRTMCSSSSRAIGVMSSPAPRTTSFVTRRCPVVPSRPCGTPSRPAALSPPTCATSPPTAVSMTSSPPSPHCLTAATSRCVPGRCAPTCSTPPAPSTATPAPPRIRPSMPGPTGGGGAS